MTTVSQVNGITTLPKHGHMGPSVSNANTHYLQVIDQTQRRITLNYSYLTDTFIFELKHGPFPPQEKCGVKGLGQGLHRSYGGYTGAWTTNLSAPSQAR